jgi:DNA (cytosine-5)-methyltransferase 1
MTTRDDILAIITEGRLDAQRARATALSRALSEVEDLVREMRPTEPVTFLEFFAGGGMARAGLGARWRCVFANDFNLKKAAAYQMNWGVDGFCPELQQGDVRKVKAADLPDADLAWASFPCQDLSLAGGGAGLNGERSGTFYPFWDVMRALVDMNRGPRVIALENVTGALTSHAGKDFSAICGAFADADYRFGAVVIDAALFVPHSRPRLFVVGVRSDVPVPGSLLAPEALAPFHTRGLRHAVDLLPRTTRDAWLWWNLPVPAHRTSTFAGLVEENPPDVAWHTKKETTTLLGMMSPINLAKVDAAQRAGRRVVGGIYKRTRPDESGEKVQRAEVRFDDVAGCLRTPAGGSSRQTILVVDGDRVRSRLISSRETARLMGLDETYRLPTRYNEAYHLTGDGVAVPVVRYLARHLFEPVVRGVAAAESAA